MENDNKEMPVYVKLDQYKDIVDIIGLLKNKISEAKSTIGKINQLKNEEDAEMEVWKAELEEVQKKVEFIDKAMFTPTSY